MASASSELSVDDHLRVAREFLDFGARVVAGSSPADPVTLAWAVTSAYYAALHAITAYMLAAHDERAATHADRDRWLRDRRFPEFAEQDRKEYFGLKAASEASRYYGRAYNVLDHTLWRQRAERIVAKWGDRARKT
jgi:hypothetical protein